jgi:tripartite-type tricarboxylate transporter receptor subunit TctC
MLQTLGLSVVIENETGANGNIGVGRVAMADTRCTRRATPGRDRKMSAHHQGGWDQG